MKLTDEMKNALKVGSDSGVVTYLTTSSCSGSCNVHLQPYTDVYKDEFIFAPDLFAQKTKININENRLAVLTIAHPAEGKTWAFRGPCNLIQWGHPPKFNFHGVTAGEVLQKWGDWGSLEPYDSVDDDIKPKAIGQRGVFVLKVEEIYSYKADESGAKIL